MIRNRDVEIDVQHMSAPSLLRAGAKPIRKDNGGYLFEVGETLIFPTEEGRRRFVVPERQRGVVLARA